MKKLITIILILTSLVLLSCSDTSKNIKDNIKSIEPFNIDDTNCFEKINDDIYLLKDTTIENQSNFSIWKEENSFLYTKTILGNWRDVLCKADYSNSIEWEYELLGDYEFINVFHNKEKIYALVNKNYKYKVICLNSNGEEEWTKKIEFNYNPQIEINHCTIEPCKDGFVISLEKDTYSSNKGDDFILDNISACIQKYDFDGNFIWIKKLDIAGDTTPYSLHLSDVSLYVAGENIYVSCESYEKSHTLVHPEDMYSHFPNIQRKKVFLLDNNGNVKNSMEINNKENDFDLMYSKDNSFYTTDEKNNLIKTDDNFTVIKKTRLAEAETKYSKYFIPCKTGMYIVFENQSNKTLYAEKYDFDLNLVEKEHTFMTNFDDYIRYEGEIDGKVIITNSYYEEDDEY